MKAEVHSPDNLDWTVKRLTVVQRPLTPEQAMATYGPRGGRASGGMAPLGPRGDATPLFAVIIDLLLFVLMLPPLPLVVALRRAGVLSFTIQARCRPWGRKGPPTVMRWKVKGDIESQRAFQEIVTALEQGSGAPTVAGAQRVM